MTVASELVDSVTGARGPLNHSTIGDVTLALARAGLSKKLAWWLIDPHSSECWFQFEWAHQLAEHFRGAYEVCCEYGCHANRVDITLFSDANLRWPLRLPSNQAAAGIEIKWFGNWYPETGITFTGDISKVERYEFPAMALSFWLFAVPVPGVNRYSWIGNAIKKMLGQPISPR